MKIDGKSFNPANMPKFDSKNLPQGGFDHSKMPKPPGSERWAQGSGHQWGSGMPQQHQQPQHQQPQHQQPIKPHGGQ